MMMMVNFVVLQFSVESKHCRNLKFPVLKKNLTSKEVKFSLSGKSILDPTGVQGRPNITCP